MLETPQKWGSSKPQNIGAHPSPVLHSSLRGQRPLEIIFASFGNGTTLSGLGMSGGSRMDFVQGGHSTTSGMASLSIFAGKS